MSGRHAVVSLLSFALGSSMAHEWSHEHLLRANVAAYVDSLLAARTGVHTGPSIAPAWSANVSVTSGSLPDPEIGTYHYEMTESHQRYRQILQIPNHIFTPNGNLFMDTLVVNQTSKFCQNLTLGKGADGVCKVMPVPFIDPFSFLPAAKQNGTRTVDGEECTVWVLEVTLPGKPTMSISLAIALDGIPREMRIAGTGSKLHDSIQTFSNVQAGSPGDAVFAPSTACATNYPTPACPSQGVTDLDLYRVHGTAEPLKLENRNLGDALGDMGFFCLMAANDSSLVSRWTVSADTSWGQYAYCLYHHGLGNVCYGNTGKHVGRESSLGLGEGHLQGQCSVNTDVGNWYSMPTEGACGEGEAIGTNGCTWAAAKLIRTVSAACILQDRGLLQACHAEMGHAPFLNATAIFKAALASSDPSRGGCPDANVTAVEDLTILI